MTDNTDTTPSMTGEPEHGEKKMPLGALWLTVTLVMAPLSPLTWYAGLALSVLLLIAAAVLSSRGYSVRGVVIGGVLALVISVGVTVGWNGYVATESEVTGQDKVKQRQSERAFDRAFERAENVPGVKRERKGQKRESHDAKPSNAVGIVGTDGGI